MPSVSFQPSAEDLIAANRLHYLGFIRKRRFLVTQSLASVGIASLAFAFIAVTRGVAAGASAFAAILLIWLAAITAILVANYLLLPRRTRRVFAQQKSLHEAVEFEWSPDGANFRSARGSHALKWSDYLSVVESPEVILLYQSEALFNFVPKRVLSAGQAQSILAAASR